MKSDSVLRIFDAGTAVHTLSETDFSGDWMSFERINREENNSYHVINLSFSKGFTINKHTPSNSVNLQRYAHSIGRTFVLLLFC